MLDENSQRNSRIVIAVASAVANDFLVLLRLFAHSFKPFHCLSVQWAGPEHVAGQDITNGAY